MVLVLIAAAAAAVAVVVNVAAEVVAVTAEGFEEVFAAEKRKWTRFVLFFVTYFIIQLQPVKIYKDHKF